MMQQINIRVGDADTAQTAAKEWEETRKKDASSFKRRSECGDEHIERGMRHGRWVPGYPPFRGGVHEDGLARLALEAADSRRRKKQSEKVIQTHVQLEMRHVASAKSGFGSWLWVLQKLAGVEMERWIIAEARSPHPSSDCRDRKVRWPSRKLDSDTFSSVRSLPVSRI